MLKKCPQCGRWLPFTMFAKKSQRCKICRRDYDWQYRYGVSPEEYVTLYKAQNGKCKICGYKPKDGEYLHIDHNKETGEIRGLLCRNCNLGLGSFKDNPENLIKAAKYVEENR